MKEGAEAQSCTEKLDNYKLLLKHGKNRIMVVDDEEFCIASLKSILVGANIDMNNKVDFCINGLEAVNLIRSSYEAGITYSMIFTDFSMPVMNGIECTSKIREVLS